MEGGGEIRIGGFIMFSITGEWSEDRSHTF
jgi:hypothetical protein